MIKLPNFLFLNCIGTYLYGICSSYYPKDDTNKLLNFLSKTELGSFEQDYTKNFDMFKLGWYSQFVDLYYNSEYIPDRQWHYLLGDYMTENIGISVKFKTADWDELSALIKKNNFEHFMIVIDDYYNPSSKFSYNRVHDTHWLYIDSYDSASNLVTVMDSNYKQSNTIPLENLESGYRSRSNTQEYCYTAKTETYEETEFNENVSINTTVFSDLRQEYSKVPDNENWIFLLDGLNNSIQSKIIPYLSYKKVQILNNCKLSTEIKSTVSELINSISRLFQSMVYRNIIMINEKQRKYYKTNMNLLDDIVIKLEILKSNMSKIEVLKV